MKLDILLLLLGLALVQGRVRERLRKEESSVKRLVFMHSTDVHGHIQAAYYSAVDSGKKYTVGGLAGLSSLVSIVQQEHQGQAMVIDSGDQFTGSLLSQYFNGSVVTSTFNQLGYQATVFGNHEFDLSQDNLQDRIEQSAFPWVSSNLQNTTDGAEFYEDASVKTEVLVSQGVKVGVVGLTTVKTYFTTSGDLTSVDISKHYLNITHHYAAQLRRQGCQVVIVNGHIGSRMDPASVNASSLQELYTNAIRDENNSTQYLLQEGRFTDFIERLDPDLVDGVLAGHTHNMLHQFTSRGIPVLITECYAKYLQLLYLDFDTSSGKVIHRSIEGPVPVCSQVFRDRALCDVDIKDNSEETNGPLEDYSFHGQTVHPDRKVEQLVAPFQKIIDQKFPSQELAFIAQAMTRDRTQEAAMQNFISDAFAVECPADVSIVNSGMIRIDWPVGGMFYQRVFETVPFDNHVVRVKIEGKTLKRVVKDIQEGELGFYGMANLQITVQDRVVTQVKVYQQDKLVQIQDEKIYTLSLPSFLLDGGDDFHTVIKYFHPSKAQQHDCGVGRDLLSDYLTAQGQINTKALPVLRPDRPRIIILN